MDKQDNSSNLKDMGIETVRVGPGTILVSATKPLLALQKNNSIAPTDCLCELRLRSSLVDRTNLSEHLFSYNVNRGEKHLRKQRNCKICQSEEWLVTSFTYGFHVEHLTYLQLIGMLEKYGISSNNFYNCSVHVRRHLEQKDFIEAEQKQARWQSIKLKKHIDENLLKLYL